MSEHPQAPAKPSLWERTKLGVKSFVGHAIGYIPRGIIFTSAVFAGSAVLETATNGTIGFGILGMKTPDLLQYGLTHLAIGSGISGVLGAASDLTVASRDPHTTGHNAPSNPLISKSESQLGHSIAKSITDTGMNAATNVATKTATDQFVGSGLPAIANATKSMGLGN